MDQEKHVNDTDILSCVKNELFYNLISLKRSIKYFLYIFGNDILIIMQDNLLDLIRRLRSFQ